MALGLILPIAEALSGAWSELAYGAVRINPILQTKKYFPFYIFFPKQNKKSFFLGGGVFFGPNSSM